MIGPGFQLGEATAAERTARDRLTFEAWGARLTRPQYLERERTLRQTEHGRLHMKSWVLRLPNGVVAASCETFRIPLAPSGAIEVVASVYVDRPLRGVKMASRLMEALVLNRREAGLDGLVLFSEIGTGLYERAGFRVLPAPTRRWSRCAVDAPRASTFTQTELAEVLGIRDAHRAGPLDVLVTEPLVLWHAARARFYAALLKRPTPRSLGAWTADAEALWVADFKGDLLRVLEVSGRPGASLEPLAAAALDEAQHLGLAAVELWDDARSPALPGGISFERDDDVPMGQAFTPRGALFLGPLSRACWA